MQRNLQLNIYKELLRISSKLFVNIELQVALQARSLAFWGIWAPWAKPASRQPGSWPASGQGASQPASRPASPPASQPAQPATSRLAAQAHSPGHKPSGKPRQPTRQSRGHSNESSARGTGQATGVGGWGDQRNRAWNTMSMACPLFDLQERRPHVQSLIHPWGLTLWVHTVRRMAAQDSAQTIVNQHRCVCQSSSGPWGATLRVYTVRRTGPNSHPNKS